MAHRNAVIHADGIELERHAARRAHGFFHNLAKFLQMDMPGNNIHIRIDNCDKRFVHIRFGNAGGAQQGTVWCFFISFFNGIGAHDLSLSHS